MLQIIYTLFSFEATPVLRLWGAGALDQNLTGEASPVVQQTARDSPLLMVLSVLGNTIGGLLLLAGTFFLPQVLADMLF